MKSWMRTLCFAAGATLIWTWVSANHASSQSVGFQEGRNGLFELILPIWKQRNQLEGATWEINVTRDGKPFCHHKGKLSHKFLDPQHTPDKRFLICPPTAALGTGGAKSLYQLSVGVDKNSDGVIDESLNYGREVIEERHLGEHPLGCIVTLYLGFVANQGAKSVFLISDSEQACG